MKIVGYHHCFFAITALFSTTVKAQSNICAEGYIMDDLCVQRGTLLDPAGTPTFSNPGIHTVHCLIDVEACLDSGYHILQDPTTEGGEYSIAHTFTDKSNTMLIDLMKAEGSCTNGCTGSVVDKFRIGVKGSTQDVDGTTKLEITESAYISADAVGTYCSGFPDGEGEPAATPVEIPVAPEPAATPVEIPVAPEPAPTPVEIPVASEPAPTPVEIPVAPEPAPTPAEIPVAPEPAPTPVEIPVTPEPAPTAVDTPVEPEPAEAPVGNPVSSGSNTYGSIVAAAVVAALV